jgi:hypothetical protein
MIMIMIPGGTSTVSPVTVSASPCRKLASAAGCIRASLIGRPTAYPHGYRAQAPSRDSDRDAEAEDAAGQ